MGWDDWRYIQIGRAQNGRIVPVSGDEDIVPQQIPDDVIRILINDDTDAVDDDSVRNFCIRYLGLGDGECPCEKPVHVFYTPCFETARDVLCQGSGYYYQFDGVIQDIIHDETGDFPGIANIELIKQGVLTPHPAVLIVTNNRNYAAQVQEHSRGAVFAIAKDPDPRDRRSSDRDSIRRFFAMAEEIRSLYNDPMISEYRNIVGRGMLRHLREFLGLLDNSPGERIPVVILGESGTGKEAVARLIHLHDRYETDPSYEHFQPVFISALSEGTKVGELFGVDHIDPPLEGQSVIPIQGHIRNAEHGTLFIDELGKLDKADQVMLLRFLQDHVYRPIGGDQWHQIQDVRCVFAANEDIRSEACQKDLLLEDFLHRIDGLTLELPSLKDRTEDHEELILYFAGKHGARNRAQCYDPFSDDLVEHLIQLCRRGAFTGNIRQLDRFIKRIVMVAEPGRRIGLDAFDKALKYSLRRPAGW